MSGESPELRSEEVCEAIWENPQTATGGRGKDALVTSQQSFFMSDETIFRLSRCK